MFIRVCGPLSQLSPITRKLIRYYRVSLRQTEFTTEPDLPEGTLVSWIHYAKDFSILEASEWLPPGNGLLEIGELGAWPDTRHFCGADPPRPRIDSRRMNYSQFAPQS